MLLGWGACFKSTLLAAAESRGIEVRRLELAVAGETADAPYRFVELSMQVLLEISGSDQEREHLLEIASRGCAVSNTLRQGAKLTITPEQEAGAWVRRPARVAEEAGARRRGERIRGDESVESVNSIEEMVIMGMKSGTSSRRSICLSLHAVEYLVRDCLGGQEDPSAPPPARTR